MESGKQRPPVADKSKEKSFRYEMWKFSKRQRSKRQICEYYIGNTICFREKGSAGIMSSHRSWHLSYVICNKVKCWEKEKQHETNRQPKRCKWCLYSKRNKLVVERQNFWVNELRRPKILWRVRPPNSFLAILTRAGRTKDDWSQRPSNGENIQIQEISNGSSISACHLSDGNKHSSTSCRQRVQH